MTAPDAFEQQARALAHSLPICDLGSAKAIQAIAIGLRETWRMATEATDEKARLLEQTIQNSAEMIRGLMAQIEAAKAKDVTWRLAYLSGVDDPTPGRKIVAINNDGSAAMMFWVHDDGLIEAEGDECTFDWFKGNFVWWSYIPDNVVFWCETRTDDPMTLKRITPDAPSDGTCTLCGSAPRNADGLCSTCVDEGASQALWRKALDQERVENDGLEECGNWGATDPVKAEGEDHGH